MTSGSTSLGGSSGQGSSGAPTPYVTYLGGAGQDQMRGVAMDAAGNVYFVGGTDSASIPGCTGTNSGNYDVIIGRFNANGTLAWCRLLGGPAYDRFYDIEVNSTGTQVVAAGRASRGFPVSSGAWDSTFNTGQPACGGPYGAQDAAVCALDAATGATVWCTYTGFANRCDFIRTIALDAQDNVILGTGVDAPVNDPQYNSLFLNGPAGGWDGVVGKLLADGSAVQWYRYVGGTGDNAVEGMVAVDSVGIYYAPAWSNDTTHQVVNGFDDTHNGGTDQYLVRLSLDGTTITYATYVGGDGGDDSGMHALVPSGTPGVVFLKAGTQSTNWPTTPGALQANRSGMSDCGVVKIDTNQTGAASLLAATYLGGSGADFCEGAALAPGGALALGGSTSSTNFPGVTNGAFPMLAGGDDGWLAVLSPDLGQVLYASYVGGNVNDTVRAVDATGGFVVGVGVADSTNVPVTSNAAQPTHNSPGAWDAVVTILPY